MGETSTNATLILRASADDAGELAEVARRTFWDAYKADRRLRPRDLAKHIRANFSPVQVADDLANREIVFLKAAVEGQIVGYVKLIMSGSDAPVHLSNGIELSRLYISREFLGSGLGAELLNESIRHATGFGAETIWLVVWEFNDRARAFYKKNGFTDVCSFPAYGGFIGRSVLMKKGIK